MHSYPHTSNQMCTLTHTTAARCAFLPTDFQPDVHPYPHTSSQMCTPSHTSSQMCTLPTAGLNEIKIHDCLTFCGTAPETLFTMTQQADLPLLCPNRLLTGEQMKLRFGVFLRLKASETDKVEEPISSVNDRSLNYVVVYIFI